MGERNKFLNIYKGQHAKVYESQNVIGKMGGGYGRICWGEGMLELMKQWQVQSLLDVGCGYGNFCDAATLFAPYVYGLDIASVATGNVVDNQDIEFIDGQANQLPLQDGAVEWITSFDCLEHCLEEDIDDILNEFNRVATKGFALSISYEPCQFEGVELHMTVHPESWWLDKLSRYGEVSKAGRVPYTNAPYIICRKPMPRTLICYCAGGLSDRLIALSTCHRLAEQTNRQLAITWQTNDPLCPLKFNELFDNRVCPLSEADLLELPSCKVYAFIKDVANQALLSGNSTLREMVRKWGSSGLDAWSYEDVHDNVVFYLGNTDLNGEMAPDPKFLNDLKPVAQIQARIDYAAQQLGIDRHIMGVHARGTDFSIDIKRYVDHMIKAIGQNHDPGQRFLVCSEDEHYVQQLKQVFKDKAIVRPKTDWVTKLDPNRGWALTNMRISGATLMESVVDLYLLSRTDFRIYHESSRFAQLCKYLADDRTSDARVGNGRPSVAVHDGNAPPSRVIPSSHSRIPESENRATRSEEPIIYYGCPDTQAVSAGIRRLYRHVSFLHASGFHVCILHTKTGFERSDMPAVPVQYMDRLNSNTNAIFVIPEGMPKMMHRLKDHAGRKFVIALSWHYVFSTLPDCLDWRHLNIERVLAVSPMIGQMVGWSMGLPVHLLHSSIDHRRYFYDPKIKKTRVAFIQRKGVNVDRLMRLLYARNPSFINNIDWIGLDGLSEDAYAHQIRQARLFISTSMAEGFPTSCLEAMAAGAVVGGYAAGGGKDILQGQGTEQNCVMAPNGDYMAFAYGLEPVLSDMLQGNMPNWDPVISNGLKTASAFTLENERESLISFWDNICKQAVQERTKASEPATQQPSPTMSMDGVN